MLGDFANRQTQSEVIRKVLSMLEVMDRSPEDNLIYNHVALLLEDYDTRHAESERLLCSLITLILSSFSTHLEPNSALYTKIKLLQFRLMSPITASELVALQHYVENCADSITEMENMSLDMINTTLEPLLQSFGLDHNSLMYKTFTAPLQESLTSKQEMATKTNGYWEFDITEFGKSLQKLFSSNYLTSSIEQSEKFGVLLEVELAALKNIDDSINFESKKNNVLKELGKILQSHQQLTQYFQKMSDFVSALQKDSIRLNEELDRVTLLSLTDELTGLPNRRAFIQRLNDEIGRVKRYGHSLSIALLDIDHFKPINDQYGHCAGDDVLKTYANRVLTLFRQQDMVARYGGEEFVVIFPNTELDGALQALYKVQKKASQLSFLLEGENKQLPTFSAGLVEYQADESINDLVARVDKVLYRAKNNGRNRIECEVLNEASLSINTSV